MRAFTLSVFLLAPLPLMAQPPRQQSPAPRDVLEAVGAGNTDAALAEAIAQAARHPLGTLDNPIRVAGPDGERRYLAGLRCGDGRPPTIGTRNAAGVGAYGSLVDTVPVDCGAAAPGKVTLAIDIYHQENPETRAPAGFQVAR
ncbi:MAG TPA: hypothetical protein VF628_09640 [Allosphingosinicella sp.]|jgi:hypothetical protein